MRTIVRPKNSTGCSATVVTSSAALLAFFAIGCGAPSGPQEKDSDFANRVVWVQTYQMEMASLPQIIWYSGCLDNYDNFALQDGCIADVIEPKKNDIRILWQGSFAGSAFSTALDEWRIYLMHGEEGLSKPANYPEWQDRASADTALLLSHL